MWTGTPARWSCSPSSSPGRTPTGRAAPRCPPSASAAPTPTSSSSRPPLPPRNPRRSRTRSSCRLRCRGCCRPGPSRRCGSRPPGWSRTCTTTRRCGRPRSVTPWPVGPASITARWSWAPTAKNCWPDSTRWRWARPIRDWPMARHAAAGSWRCCSPARAASTPAWAGSCTPRSRSSPRPSTRPASCWTRTWTSHYSRWSSPNPAPRRRPCWTRPATPSRPCSPWKSRCGSC